MFPIFVNILQTCNLSSNTAKHGHMTKNKIISPNSAVFGQITETNGPTVFQVPLVEIWVCLKMLCTPLYPMVLLIIIPMKNGYFIGGLDPIFRQWLMNG